MLCPVLIGRGAELAALTAALDRAAEGRGGAVFITGDAGIGKSRLTRDVAYTASARDFQVLTGRSTQSAVPVPYRPIAEALMGAARAGMRPSAPGISDYRSALGALVPEWSRPDSGEAYISPVVIGEAVLRLLASSPGSGGLLVIEDVHWADPETLAVIEYLIDNVAGTNVLCVVTLRDGGPSEAINLLQSAADRRVARRVEVPRLTPAAIREMAAACLDVPHAPAPVGALLADCDGLPFAVEEILAAAVSSGALARDEHGWHVNADVSTGVPDSIAGSVRRRLAALGPGVASVVISAAVLGRQFDWTLLPAVAGVNDVAALDALQRAHEVQLIEPASVDAATFRFRHSLTREAILADLLPPDLASRSAVAAAAIEEAHPGLPGMWCELAAELRAAAGQIPEATSLLVTAAERAVQQGAVSTAIETLSDAQDLLADSSQNLPAFGIKVDEVLVEALYMAGDNQRLQPLATSLIDRLRAAGADPRREVLVRLRAASTRPEDDPATTAEHLAAARAIAADLSDTELTSRIEAVAARSALVAGDFDRAEELASRALAAAEATGLRAGWAAEVALESLEVIGRRERARDLDAARAAFERSGQVARDSGLGIWQIRSQHELGTIEMLTSGSTSKLAEVRDLAHDAGAICVGSIIDLQLANVWSLGTEPDLEKAMAAAQRCERASAQIKAPRIEAMAICLQANIAATRGDIEQAERLTGRAEARLPDDPEILATTYGQTRVLAALFRDDIQLALKHNATAAEYGRLALAMPQRSQGFYSVLQAPLVAPRRAVSLNAMLQVTSGGDAQGALRLAREIGAATSWNAGCLAYAEAVLEGRAGNPGRAGELAREGSAQLAPFATWWNHLFRRLVAPAALRDGWGEPVAWLREAASDFDASGYDRLASACRGLLRRAGERVPRAGRGTARVPGQMRRLGITSREMDVFLLVARGHSNTEIAAKLYISPKTVETHIASLITKTGRRGRRELVAHAARLITS
jgi:DNA-binding CsgD family transcriptional regulator/tetratricopeptide (TPR) repeat protein